MRMTFFSFLAFLLLLPNNVLAQGDSSIPAGQSQKAIPGENVPGDQQVAPAQTAVVREKHPRLFCILPTYTVSNSKVPISLSSGEKFRLFVRNTTDPFTKTSPHATRAFSKQITTYRDMGKVRLGTRSDWGLDWLMYHRQACSEPTYSRRSSIKTRLSHGNPHSRKRSGAPRAHPK
jgi:hypothetical protein